MDRFWQRFWEASCVLFKRSSLLFLHYYCLKMLFCRIFAFATGSSFEEMALQWWREKCANLYNDWQLNYTAGTFFVVTGSYWVLGGFFMILDQTGWLSRYKIRPGINQPPDARELGKVVCTVLFNQIIIVLPYTTMSYYAMQIRAGPMSQERLCEVPSFERMALELVFNDIIFDITLYSSHVLLHTKWLYITDSSTSNITNGNLQWPSRRATLIPLNFSFRRYPFQHGSLPCECSSRLTLVLALSRHLVCSLRTLKLSFAWF
ncbi:fatty acid hydroxylase domain-containing protein 2-like [Neocloeon triangulifer]|uniref:fatty acid hydroxylase domain-containing protein 2-like n=1 Tax=Neocloeon triangulifer TaxID=2078957 RepID=UPI00286F84EF|nr:fatty acid hydroxylase domain-containing protein 2-like [Neocloeon triangulifer]